MNWKTGFNFADRSLECGGTTPLFLCSTLPHSKGQSMAKRTDPRHERFGFDLPNLKIDK